MGKVIRMELRAPMLVPLLKIEKPNGRIIWYYGVKIRGNRLAQVVR